MIWIGEDIMQKIDSYKTLEEAALEMGYPEVKVIPADDIVVEDRVRLKCIVGCPHYGKGLRCPPYTPSINEFRKILNDYSFAMLIKLKQPKISNELKSKYNLNNLEELDRLQDRYDDVNKTSARLWSDFAVHYKNALMDLLELEKAAFSMGYTFATLFFAGRCMLCEKCDVETGMCRNPVIARFSAEAMGINLLKTAENAVMELNFDSSDSTGMALLLID
jgi:predicted metal-binding protein